MTSERAKEIARDNALFVESVSDYWNYYENLSDMIDSENGTYDDFLGALDVFDAAVPPAVLKEAMA